MLQENAGWIAIGAIALVLALAWLVAAASSSGPVPGGVHRGRRSWRRRPHRNEFRPEGHAEGDTSRRQAVIVVNPTKFEDLPAVRRRIGEVCRDLGWDEPRFIETTKKDPGTGQAKEALEHGATVVCALGGDGTVRAVAEALVGSETPMGLLPGGTGNLLARNLDLPVDSLEDAVRVALTGQNKRVDVGRLTVDVSGEHERPECHIFLVMAGLGFDAAIMAGAPEKLKAKVGWPAYVVSGFRNLRGPQFKVRVKTAEGDEFSRRTRTVVIGNCGKLLGGLVLMPEAEVDDGRIDLVALSPQGIVGWAAVAARLASRRRRGHPRVDHYTTTEVQVRADRPQEVQLDGDPIGEARAISAEVLPSSLIVRVGAVES
ncbi:diacylglycerol kinase family protein [Knoellia sp. p5-6-4]|uniref:diacylglycerol/lipid kinase family protein n=1 Tax=unclassified Knoellia TaxID=2618719 RepID=UPI0023DA4668|nr:diacylglycerol kinase family protein [Knoellia sp. p5-6-4]MDF2144973.1 diacylglycerol kinase family protein [Knoellia sp. p5-6-4]